MTPLGEHGLISDTFSAALTTADGTLEWWCPRRFDAAPVLTRLLDPDGAAVGFGAVTPRGQRYAPGTFTLRSLLEGVESMIEVTDTLWSGRIVRRVHALRGPAVVKVTVAPGSARDVSWWSEGVAFDGVLVRCGAAFEPGGVSTAEVRLDTGEGMVVTIDAPGVAGELLSLDAALLIEDRAARSWRSVGDRIDIDGRWAEDAARSALVVHALSGFGAPILSPVTSLPRVVGGERNTDGRMVAPGVAATWASLATAIGLAEDADAAATWLARALEQDPPLPLVLDLDGVEPATEAIIAGLPGWHRSDPVVAGTNLGERRSVEPAAAAIAVLASWPSAPIDRLARHAEWLAEHWGEPDASAWGLRPGDRHWTAPRLAARRALLAAAASARGRDPLDLDAARWHAAARDIEGVLLTLPTPVLGSGVAGVTDASIVRMADWGPWPVDDEVVRATTTSVAVELGDGAWIHPYSPELDDDLEGVEPASVTATLWLARALALAGRWDEAHARVEEVAALAGPLHLLPEAVDVAARGALGNRPSSAAHVAFIGAALALADAPR
ncbi:MAG: trehalase-like domain-containing protein [Acidimicrobiales bacterium]